MHLKKKKSPFSCSDFYPQTPSQRLKNNRFSSSPLFSVCSSLYGRTTAVLASLCTQRQNKTAFCMAAPSEEIGEDLAINGQRMWLLVGWEEGGTCESNTLNELCKNRTDLLLFLLHLGFSGFFFYLNAHFSQTTTKHLQRNPLSP